MSDDSLPSVLSDAYAALVAEQRGLLHARQRGMAQLFEQDLTLWFASVGAVALLLAGLLKIASMPIWPTSVRTAVLVLLMVTLAITVFLMAASAPNMRGWFRGEAARRQVLAQRLETSTHAEAISRIQERRPVVLMLRTADPLGQLEVSPAEPVGIGFLPRAGAVSVGPSSRHDPFPRARVQGIHEGPGLPVEPTSLPTGTLEDLQLFSAEDQGLLDVLPPDASPVGVALLDEPEVATEVPAWPCVDLLSMHEDHVFTELFELVHGVVLEVPQLTPEAALEVEQLGSLGSRLLVVVPTGLGRAKTQSKTGTPMPRPPGVVVVERGRTSLARGVRRWWAGLGPREGG